MARRIPLPRLTRRQRLARWQRERRQRAFYLAAFTTVLLLAFGLVAWAGASRYYDENLKPAARVAGQSIPMRDFNRRLALARAQFFQQQGVPESQENHPQLRPLLASLRKDALNDLVLGAMLDAVAREQGDVPSADEVQGRVDREFGELHVRHILVTANADEKDKQKADADAKAKAEAMAKQLRADPTNEQLWNDVAGKESQDPGSKDKGGDLGWVNASSGFVKEFEEAVYALADGQISDPVKSTFGYHVIQRIEARPVTRTPLYARARRDGLTLDDFTRVARTRLLRDRYEASAKAAPIPSPQEQVRLAVITVKLGSPSQPEEYLASIKKLNLVKDKIDAGEDFAGLAKKESDDVASRDKGGEIGWVTRAMLSDEVADDAFKRQVGERTEQHGDRIGSPTEVSIYKVLEKSAAREVTDEQKAKMRDKAFDRWLAEQERRLGVERLLQDIES